MMRGRLDTVEEITIVTAAVELQNMLGLPKNKTQKDIQTKLAKTVTKKDLIEPKIVPSEGQIKTLQEDIEEIENVQDCSLKSFTKCNIKEEEIKTPQIILTSNERRKREKAATQMIKLASQVQVQMQNPFTYFDNPPGKSR